MSLSEKLSVKVHLLKSALPGAKGRFEMDYWKNKFQEEGGKFKNDHYEHLYTTVWGLGHDFFEGKKMLDIGCGPRGSLEWADMTAERVGIDPIVDKYRGLGIEKHKMRYCHSPVEKAPFEDGHFDIVTSFNSLDHVDAVDPAIAEWLWHQALPYFDPLTPHPDDHLLDDAMIDEGDIEQHWWGDFARNMELDETTGPDWPQDWAFTVRNFARWLQLAQREPAPDQPIQRHSPAGT